MPDQENNLREKFLITYPNLPLNARKETILVLEGQPITWEVAYFEIRNDTPASKKILQKLQELKLL
ncbi:MAG: hypothetical protein Q7K98_05380 [Candidatus Omnitrophota bacterium]|nr:hypothetical protein [Candidatus Omnitrophota bacterium]